MKQEQDLRTLFKEEKKSENYILKTGHKDRFLKVLEQEFPQQRKSYRFLLQIAASILLLIGAGIYFYLNQQPNAGIETTIVGVAENEANSDAISLGDLSPDLKKVEQYYVANINIELAQLKISEENKVLVDGFMERLAELNVEYQLLTKELNTVGPNDQTIAALIKNLQLRLQLLQKLKEKLNELKSSENETAINV
tara:strand:+ start:39521 stop:40108 length:588 start_codon:yes stop_codon:yes gene_type:complete